VAELQVEGISCPNVLRCRGGFSVNRGGGETLRGHILHLANDPALCVRMGASAFEQRGVKRPALAKGMDVIE
jgi:hypothetical protein